MCFIHANLVIAMSTRQTRRLAQQKDSVAQGTLSYCSDSDTVIRQKTTIGFDVFADSDSSSDKSNENNVEFTNTFSILSTLPTNDSVVQRTTKKKKKKIKRKLAPDSTTKLKSDSTILDTAKLQSTSCTSKLSDLLKVQLNRMNADKEMKRIFQISDSLDKPRNRQRNAPNGTFKTLKKVHMVTPSDNWPRPPPFIGGGVKWTRAKCPEGPLFDASCHYFEIYPSIEYKKIGKTYETIQSVHDVQLLSEFVQHNPYHLDSLVQMSEILQHHGQMDHASECIKRCLYACELSWGDRFDTSSGMCRMDFGIKENQVFYRALFLYMKQVGRRGCVQSAFEISRLLFGLDPHGDPMNVALAMDYYALASRRYAFVLELVEAEIPVTDRLGSETAYKGKNSLSALPNLQFSISLALFYLDRYDEAVEQLSRALLQYPSMLRPLLEACGITIRLESEWDQVLRHSVFNNAHRLDESGPLQHVLTIYINRSKTLWRFQPLQALLLDSAKKAVSSATLQSAFPAQRELIPPLQKYRRANEQDYSDDVTTLPQDLPVLEEDRFVPAEEVLPPPVPVIAREEETEEESEGLSLHMLKKYEYAGSNCFFQHKSYRTKHFGSLRCSENYIRHDLECGIQLCRIHSTLTDANDSTDTETVIIPDASCIYQCIAIIEKIVTCTESATDKEQMISSLFPIVIVLETVMEQLKEWLPNRERLRCIAFIHKYPFKQSHISYFPDQNHYETFQTIQSKKDTFQTMAQQNVREAVKWFASTHSNVNFVYLTKKDSNMSQDFLPLQNITMQFAETYFDGPIPLQSLAFLPDFIQSLHSMAMDWQKKRTERDTFAERNVFESHLTMEEMKTRLGRNALVSGKLHITKHSSSNGFVHIRQPTTAAKADIKVYVSGLDLNRAIHGDRVAVELFHKEHWRVPITDRLLIDDDAELKDNREPDSSSTSQYPVPTGKIVGILQRSSQIITATVLSTTIRIHDSSALAVPMNKRFPKVRIRSHCFDTLSDQRLSISIDDWPASSTYPNGHYKCVLGPSGDITTELNAILMENDILQADYSEAALACLPHESQAVLDTYRVARCSSTARPSSCPLLDYAIPEDEIKSGQRRDLRLSHRIFSIDPIGCQDIDDAVSIRMLANGNLELGVHIADVSFYVTQDSALDQQAQRRGTTVYLIGQRLDMLPCVLSADLCSLHANRDRFAVSVLWELDAQTFDLQHIWFGRTAIRSCAALSYEQAHQILHHTDPHESIPFALQQDLKTDLSLLTNIARKFAQTRAEQGALDLTKDEQVQIAVHGAEVNERQIEIETKRHLEIHNTVAELMIFANTCVAQKIVSNFPQQALLRRHALPKDDAFETVKQFLQDKGMDICAESKFTLQQSLALCSDSKCVSEKALEYLKSLIVRGLQEAEYICASQANKDSKEPFAHYGLGLQVYTHFTSPIRRYADIIVHRQLLEAVEKENNSVFQGRPMIQTTLRASNQSTFTERVSSITTNSLNIAHRNAKHAARQCEKLFLALFFTEHMDIATAIITSIKENGFAVYVPQYDIRGPVFLSDKNGIVDTSSFVSKENTLKYVPQMRLQYDAEQGELSVYDAAKQKRVTIFHVLDHVQVRISSDVSSACHARVPELRFQLQNGMESAVTESHSLTEKKRMLHAFASKHFAKDSIAYSESVHPISTARTYRQEPISTAKKQSLYSIIQHFTRDGKEPQTQHSTVEYNCKRRGPGRFVFGKLATHSESGSTASKSSKYVQYVEARSIQTNRAMEIHRNAHNASNSASVNTILHDPNAAYQTEQALQTRAKKLFSEKRESRRKKQV